MAKNIKNYRTWHLIITILIVLFVVITAAAYTVNNSATRVITRVIPYPAVFVNASPVPLSSYYSRLSLVQSINKGNPTAAEKNDVLDKLASDRVVLKESQKRGVTISDADVDGYFSYLKNLTGQRDVSKDYGLSEKQFKNLIVRPDLISVKLQQKLSEDHSLNSNAYAELKKVQSALDAKIPFEDAAQQFSDDKGSGKLGGDIGFVGRNDVVPELYDDVTKISDQNVHIFVSRYGIHIYKVLGKDNLGADGSTRYHLKQIFIRTQDFGQWLNQTEKNYRIIKLAR